MCEAYWPFNACSFGGECNVTLGVCVCRESFSLSQHMFKDYGLDCAVPNIAIHLLQKGGLFLSIVNVVLLFVTMRKKNYFSRLKNAQNRAKAIEYRRCMLLGTICDFSLLGGFARLEFEGVENITYLEDVPYTVFTYTVGFFFWLFVFERLMISAENAIALDHLKTAHMMTRLVGMRVAGRRILIFLALCMTLGTGLTYLIWWRPAWIIVYYSILSLVICVMTVFGDRATKLMVDTISEQLTCASLPKASSDELKRLKLTFERAPRITRAIAAQSLMTTVPAMVVPWLWSWSSFYVILHTFNAVLTSLALKKLTPRIVKKRPTRKNVPSNLSNAGSRKVSPASATGNSVLTTAKTVSKSTSEVGES